MFVDEVEIEIKGGKGGDGALSFRREKYVPYGGPDGGDGAPGGAVILQADSSLHTLLDFRYKRRWKAPGGGNGEKSNRSGARGEDLIIPVPAGTLVKDEKGHIIADLVNENEQVKVAEGGRGGRGNRRFVNSRRQTPRLYEKGLPGEERTIKLELKLIADVAIVGFPNAGKSTLISRISAAHPKIADYPFTTLTPHLGVVSAGEDNSFVMVDLPGLIENAHEGVGQGDKFLRHAERSLLLIHLVDISESATEPPFEAFLKLDRELKLYSDSLYIKPRLLVGSKADLTGSKDNLQSLKERFKKHENNKEYNIIGVMGISAATGEGLKELINFLAARVFKLREEREKEELESRKEGVVVDLVKSSPQTAIIRENDAFRIVGEKIQRFAMQTDFFNDEALQRFQRTCKRMGIEDMLREKGAREGDTVRVGEYEFEFEED